MGSSRMDEQMAIVAAMLKAIADDIRQLRRAVETGMAAHARHVAREAKYQEMSSQELLAGKMCVLCGEDHAVGRHSVCGTCAAGLEHYEQTDVR
jgi:DNA-binding GntR family transcriptional regulator